MFMHRTMRVLVVANRTAATPRLLDEIEQRAVGGSCEFALLVPDGDGRQPDWTLDVALSAVEQAAGRPVRTVECDRDRDALATLRRLLSGHDFDEVIVSTRPARGPRWLRTDLAGGIERLGVPVTVVSLDRAGLDRGVLRVRWD